MGEQSNRGFCVLHLISFLTKLIIEDNQCKHNIYIAGRRHLTKLKGYSESWQ
jgi:hypothetical protein